MFGKIVYMNNNEAHVENTQNNNTIENNLMNIHVVFESTNQKTLGEIKDIDPEIIRIKFLGEFIDGKYISGIIKKPSLNSTIRVITGEELSFIIENEGVNSLLLGTSPLYQNYPIHVNINNLFSNHLAVLGNSGSGKSCGVSRIVQNIFLNKNMISYNANLFIFDAYGEYKTAFSKIHEINPNYSYKFITTNPIDNTDSMLQIPIYLLNLDDMALLLQATNHSQLPIIERMLKLANIFSKNDEKAVEYKNHLIAKALLAVLFSNQTTTSKKNEIFSVIEACSTDKFNFNANIQGIGYTRKLSECFEIDSNGNFGESVLINDYILSFLKDDIDTMETSTDTFYTLNDLEKALDFTMISEGFQHNTSLYDQAIILKVRLHTIVNSEIGKYFNYSQHITINQFISSLVVGNNNRKAQIVNINLEDLDDSYAKIIVKIFNRLFFTFAKNREDRASVPFHLFIEEAHRSIQNDTDKFLIGYNIFERIAKEGRKYGILLNIITQRPVELSETIISQCSNFFIFKMTHPRDLLYMKKMLPNISSDIIEKQKSLQPGTCVAFGSAFKIPMIIKMEMPNPANYSSNCDVRNRWDASNH